MPRLRKPQGNIGRRTRNAQIAHNHRLNRTAEDQLTDNVKLRNQVANTRANESREHHDERLRANALRQREARRRVTDAHRRYDRQRMQELHALTCASFHRLAGNRSRKELTMNEEPEEVGAHSLFEVKHETDDFASEDLPPVELRAKETIFVQVKEEPTEFVDMGEPAAELKIEGLGFSKIKEEPMEAAAVNSELELKKEMFEFLPVKDELTSEHHEEDANKIQLENLLVQPSGNTSDTGS